VSRPNRIRKVGQTEQQQSDSLVTVGVDLEGADQDSTAMVTMVDGAIEEVQMLASHAPIVPDFWHKGQLLNVRNFGDAYIITLLGEEYDPEHPERSIRFTNPGECQNFVSDWYARQHHNPLAR
jgi:hypothetical protein